jgi:hypothetical protein
MQNIAIAVIVGLMAFMFVSDSIAQTRTCTQRYEGCKSICVTGGRSGNPGRCNAFCESTLVNCMQSGEWCTRRGCSPSVKR